MFNSVETTDNFIILFSNEFQILRTPDMDLKQACHHLHQNDPHSRLAPFKLEELSSQPYITGHYYSLKAVFSRINERELSIGSIHLIKKLYFFSSP